jgi:hypothetical protein
VALYYVLMDASDSVKEKQLVPTGFKAKRFLLAVEADDADAARALMLDSFSQLAREKNFGDPMVANKNNNGWTLDLPD